MADPVVPAEGENQQVPPPQNDQIALYEKRLRDMQAMKDRAEARLRELQPIIEQVQSRSEPQRGPQGVPSMGDDADAIPQRPEPPDGYDEHAAYTVPGSESWKYRKAVEKYRDQVAEYQLNQTRKAQLEAQRRLQVQREMAMVHQVKGNLRTWAQSEKGLDEASSLSFAEDVSRDEFFKGPNGEPDPDVLFVIWQAVRNYRNGGKVPAPTREPAEFGPPPGGGGGTVRASSEDESRSINEALLSHRKRLRVGGR